MFKTMLGVHNDSLLNTKSTNYDLQTTDAPRSRLTCDQPDCSFKNALYLIYETRYNFTSRVIIRHANVTY